MLTRRVSYYWCFGGTYFLNSTRSHFFERGPSRVLNLFLPTGAHLGSFHDRRVIRQFGCLPSRKNANEGRDVYLS